MSDQEYLYDKSGRRRLVLSWKKVIKKGITKGTYYREEYLDEDGTWQQRSMLHSRKEFYSRINQA